MVPGSPVLLLSRPPPLQLASDQQRGVDITFVPFAHPFVMPGLPARPPPNPAVGGWFGPPPPDPGKKAKKKPLPQTGGIIPVGLMGHHFRSERWGFLKPFSPNNLIFHDSNIVASSCTPLPGKTVMPENCQGIVQLVFGRREWPTAEEWPGTDGPVPLPGAGVRQPGFFFYFGA